ncbi:MAG TPA: SPOR domain-containing protein, partial [Gemmatimonadaceae bacterium]
VTPPVMGMPIKQEPRWTPKRMAAVAGVVLTVGLAAAAAWLAYRPLAGSDRPRAGARCDTTDPTGQDCRSVQNTVGIRPDSTRSDSLVAVAAGAPAPVILNPGDSLLASAFAVELMAANTQAGAILKLQKDGKSLPAVTFSPAVIQGARWFKVVTGAFSDRAEADSLLAGLGRRKLLLGGESVVKLPFAFLIDSALAAAAVPAMVATYAERGQPVYALRQRDGTAWLLVGAFETVEQASLYVETLRASGIQPVLVYRKGRPF